MGVLRHFGSLLLVEAARRCFAFCLQAFEQNFAVLIPLNRLPQDWHRCQDVRRSAARADPGVFLAI